MARNMIDDSLVDEVKERNKQIEKIKSEFHKVIIGHDDALSDVLKSCLCGGHVLIEGVPGIAKTLMVVVLSKLVSGSLYKRIQFTPDLLPSDITGTSVYEKQKGFYLVKGPIFANIIAGDEINRAPPKVQSAMLEAMAERNVTIGKETMPLPDPFMVLATQNPLETRDVYPLPEAQLDRFLMKVVMEYTTKAEEAMIVDSNLEVKSLSDYKLEPVFSVKDIQEINNCIKKIYIAPEIKKYIVALVTATRNPKRYGIEEARYMQWGASPRASIYLALSARATALMEGRVYTMPEDVRAVAKPVLRHRIILNYEGKARQIKHDEIIDAIIKKVPVM
ncbi:MAG: MoxR family ATPase [Candidatus Altiarchaeota archaeon]